MIPAPEGDDSLATQVASSAAAADVVVATLGSTGKRLSDNRAGSRAGEVEPIHRMRVGARRLRSDMRLVRPLVDEDWSRSLVDELKWLGGVLGPVRDIDVLHGNLRESAGALADDLGPFFAWLEDRREGALGAAREALDSPRFDNLLERVLEGAHAPHLTPMAERPCHEVLPPLARGAWNKASRHARGLDSDASAKALHRLRILTKRARYAAELIGPALSAKRATSAARFASRARSVQDLLGRVQDSVVARSALAAGIDALLHDKAVVLAAGRLFERQEVAAGEARSSLPETWGKLDRPPLRVWMQS